MTPATTPSSSLQNLPDFGSLFGFDNRLKALEDNLSEFKQTNQYAEALSSIPGIVDQYLANKMKEAVDVAVQLKSDRIREEAQAENQQFLDSIDEGIKKVIKEQVKSELKKILIDKMEANKSINRSDIQKQLHKALVDAYEADKILLDTYGDTVTIKRPRDGADDDQEPSAGTDRGSKIKVGNYANLRCLLIALLIMSLKGVHVNKRKKKSSSFPELVQQPNSTTFIPIMHGTKFCTAYVFMNPSTLAADYGHIKWIEDLVPNSKWSQVIVSYDKIRSLGNLTLGPRSGGQFYAFATIKGNLLVGVFTSKRRIIDVTKRAWEDFYLGVEKAIKRKSTSHALSSKIYLRRSSLAFTPYSDPRGFIYENKDKKNRLMHIDELHKFSDGTLDDVRTALNDRLKGIRMDYLPQTFLS
ncbi:hypothetical protein Tco_0680804 [Tanacetum coccineum]|uniref:Uncharacterized protein n=1 Tax=Tanacetum coccineum TaxID=301880 RepID=A0ABQ4XLJ1_9ASTR